LITPCNSGVISPVRKFNPHIICHDSAGAEIASCLAAAASIAVLSRSGMKDGMTEQLDRDGLFRLHCNSFSSYMRIADILGRCRWYSGVPP
jgi:hypothetical protein